MEQLFGLDDQLVSIINQTFYIYILSLDRSSQKDFRFHERCEVTLFLKLGALRNVKEHHIHIYKHPTPLPYTHMHKATLIVTSPNFQEAFGQAVILPLSDKIFLLNFPLSPSPPLLYLYNDKNSIMESFKGGYFLSVLIYFLCIPRPLHSICHPPGNYAHKDMAETLMRPNLKTRPS